MEKFLRIEKQATEYSSTARTPDGVRAFALYTLYKTLLFSFWLF